MSESTARMALAVAAIDAANADDPRLIRVAGVARPYEVVYGERMTERLGKLYPQAGEALRLAARAQHIRRWEVVRSQYPEGRAGYNDWRKAAREHHVAVVTPILEICGFDAPTVARVGMLLRKEQLKKDPDSQALENVVAVVFVEHYLDEFLERHVGYDDDKIVDILGKTLRKMSPKGHQAALALELPERARGLIGKALEREAAHLAKLAEHAVD